MDAGLVAAWVGVVVSLAVGAAGFVTAVLSVRAARKSNRVAELARQEAQTANELAREANTISRQSNSLAVDANKLSEHANTLAERSIAMTAERNDVRWELHWKDPSEVLVVNRGDDEARGVKATVYIDGNEYTGRADLVPTNVAIPIKIGTEGDKLMAEYREGLAASQRHPYGLGDPGIHLLTAQMHVVWFTELGQQLTYRSDPTFFAPDNILGH
ncbi:hypothetical protein [Brevibacterium luteolum]|uniref:hypothetical protein n=1 Tax=Brevibacterium luteolum TaxID=199591 RepID=UPI003B671DA4